MAEVDNFADVCNFAGKVGWMDGWIDRGREGESKCVRLPAIFFL